MNVFDASSFSERMGNGRSSLCRVGEPVKGFTRSNHPAKCRKEKGGIILKAKTKLTKLWSFLLSLVMLLSLLPTTAFAAGSAETTDVTEIKLTGNYQYGTVPAGVLPAFNPGTTTEGIRMGTNAGWSYFINETSVWSGFGLETPTAVNDGKTKYGYIFQVKTNDGYQLASDLKVIYNDEDVTSTVEVTRWAWGAYVTVDLSSGSFRLREK